MEWGSILGGAIGAVIAFNVGYWLGRLHGQESSAGTATCLLCDRKLPATASALREHTEMHISRGEDI